MAGWVGESRPESGRAAGDLRLPIRSGGKRDATRANRDGSQRWVFVFWRAEGRRLTGKEKGKQR